MQFRAGLLFVVVATAASFYLLINSGTISYWGYWLIGFIVLGLLGARLWALSFLKLDKTIRADLDAETEALKRNSEKVHINFDNCKFKSGSFTRWVEDENMRSAKILTGTSRHMPNKLEHVAQSYLVYYHERGGKEYVSQSFPFDQTTLKFYVLNGNLALYVHRFDESKYLFELNA
ncbi:MAG TPA: hypothetical protein VF476_08610 [Chitinophagaceae bacterium]